MDTAPVSFAAGAAATVTFALQWARKNQAWPEWANALVVLVVALGATFASGAHPFLPAFGSVLVASGAAGYLASTASHLPITRNVVPASNTSPPSTPAKAVDTVTTVTK